MASIFLKRGKFWARLKGDKQPGKWSNAPTGETDPAKAQKFADLAQAAIDKRNKVRAVGDDALRHFVKQWLVKRQEAGHDWRKDRGRLAKHVLPVLGDLAIADITTAHVVDLVHDLRFLKHLAGRTVRNIYSVLAAVLRDAAFAGKIPASPCILTEVQLGPIVDKDPEWRDGALFTREEAQAMISDPRIPLDRRVVYALGLLAGLRIGEGAALRWRHYDATAVPLGRLTVALSYSTTYSKAKRTKTESTKSIPVHPTLAQLLTSWRSEWPTMMGREPEPDDLIVPLPPSVKRTKRTGDRFRGWDYTGRRWRDLDLKALGWRARSVYDTRATFITLAVDDGADRTILRERVTHTKPRRDAFDGYDRGPHWIATCREVARLRIEILAPACTQPANPSNTPRQLGSEGGYRMPDLTSSCETRLGIVDGEATTVMSPGDLWLAMVGANPCSHDEDEEADARKAVG